MSSLWFLLGLTLVGCGPAIDGAGIEGKIASLDPPMTPLKLTIMHDNILVSGSFVFNVSCDNTFGTSASSDWQQSNISATTSVSVVSGVACHLALVSYNNGTTTYTAVGSSLIVNVSSSGVVSTASPLQYTSGGASPTFEWFGASQGGSTYSVVINYAADSIINTTSVTQNNLSALAISLSISNVAAPSVSGVTLTIAASSGSFNYTLTATVSGSTGCKYIDNSSSTYTPTSWTSVNTAYSAAGATACPTLAPGSATAGNWNNRWQTGKTTLVMWANASGGVNAYTTANFGP